MNSPVPVIDFDLTDLRLFCHVAQAGSITAGAQASHLSLAAASARVVAMEAALSTALFVRGRRGVQPTAAGQTLLLRARQVLDQAEHLRRELEAQARGHKEHITIVGTSAAIREYLPAVLGDFLVQHAQVNATLLEAAAEEAMQALKEGVADIALVTRPTPAPQLQVFDYLVNSFALVVPRGHPLALEARGRPISIARADSHDVVGLLEGSALQDTWDARARSLGIRLNYRLRVPSFDAQVRLIELGVGVALLPDATARRFARSMNIEALPLSDPHLTRRLYIAVRELAALPASGQALVQALRATDLASADRSGP